MLIEIEWTESNESLAVFVLPSQREWMKSNNMQTADDFS